MKSKAIFIAGIHGVGKTTFSKQLNKKINLPYFSAGELIKNFQKVDTKDKKIKDLNLNQNILLESLKQLEIKTDTYLLDGHFCLLDKKLEVQEIPIEVFRELNIKKVFLLTNSASIIQARLKKRDNLKYPFDVIKKLQEREILICKKYCKKLGLEMIEINDIDFFLKNYV